MKESPYKVYTKPGCPWCVKAKQALNDLGIPFIEMKLDVDYTKEDLKKLVSENLPLTLPVVMLYNTKYIGGYEDLMDYIEKHVSHS